ncbi:MAG: hypothetical protein RL563_2205 [Pseudomonadota bacterium]
MAFMRWNDDYLTGIEIVDQQHQHLVELINAVAPTLAVNELNPNAHTSGLIDALIDYVAVHFSTEDNLMVSSGIDARHLEHHRRAHNEFAQHVLFLRQQFEHGEDLNGTDLLRFLSNWLAFHILGEDQHMARELNAITNGLPADEAYSCVEGSKAELLQTANGVLVNALVNLFAQLTEQNRVLVEKNLRIESVNRELDHQRLTLANQVKERTAELLKAKEAAEAASNAKSRFLAVMSHELLTPMNAIMGFSHLIEHAKIPEKQREQARRIKVASEQLNSLLNEILQYARLESGEMTLESHSFRASTLISQVIEHIQQSAQKKNLRISSEIEAGLPQLIGDKNLLRHALEVLAINAVKFTENGSIKFLVRRMGNLHDDGKLTVIFEIIDTGMGIPPEKQHQLFQAFELLDASSTRRHQGIGLGLVICARIVRLLGGSLSVESQPHQGSCFTIKVDLGISDEYDAEQSLDSASIESSLRELKSLLSQDNISARYLFFKLKSYLQGVDSTLTQIMASHIEHYAFDLALQSFEELLQIRNA